MGELELVYHLQDYQGCERPDPDLTFMTKNNRIRPSSEPRIRYSKKTDLDPTSFLPGKLHLFFNIYLVNIDIY